VRPLLLFAIAAALGWGGLDGPPDPINVEMGANSFRVHCAVCHGTHGEGDGPYASQLRYAPADLTRIAKRNKGKFDPEMVQRIIDGRRPVKGHGGSEMPVWGDAFLDNREGYSREAVRHKISQIVDFLGTIQRP
jgi:mono/diheme cytochrome c family protein